MHLSSFFNPYQHRTASPYSTTFFSQGGFASTAGIQSFYNNEDSEKQVNSTPSFSKLLRAIALSLISQLASLDASGNDWYPDDTGIDITPIDKPSKPQEHSHNRKGIRLTRELRQKFDKIDLNNDNFLMNTELKTAKDNDIIDGNIDKLLKRSPELMFAAIDSGNGAWFGLSKTDLNVIQQKLKADRWAKLSDVASEVRKGSWLGEQLGPDHTRKEFVKAVKKYRKEQTAPSLPK